LQKLAHQGCINGKVMGLAAAQLGGTAEGKTISTLVTIDINFWIQD
jgi:hypothetical protein